VGLVFGVVAALLRDVTDTRIQDLREISRELGPLPLCVLPYQKARASLTSGTSLDREIGVARAGRPALPACRVASLAPDFSAAVAQRSAPAFGAGDQLLEGEGKSFLSWNLAILFAQQGKRCPVVRC
jgi:succinoglycan biosynthesis transport protein ExoP